MKNSYKINKDALFCVTGEPFVDAGGFALKELATQFPEKDILELIEFATQIYVDRWDAKINSYFLNSKITQPAFKGERKKIESMAYFKGLLDGTIPSEKGFCRITGQYTDLYKAGRDNTVLSGSGTFVNFHHAFAAGIMLSKEALIRYYFLPLASELVQNKIAVISSNNAAVAELYARQCCTRILADIGKNHSLEILKSQCRSVGTAIFRFLDNVYTKYKDEGKGDSITLYHFTNFGASPEVQIYTLPSQVFLFYRICNNVLYKQEWNNFVSCYYTSDVYKKASFDSQSNNYVMSNNKSGAVVIEEKEYRYWKNIIYDNLLFGNSILKPILKYSKKSIFNLDLLKIYLINIRNMKKETVEKIYQIADFIIQAYDESDMKGIIRVLDGVKNPYLLRRFILKKVIEKNYLQGNEMLVSVDDYVNYLFPDTSSWMETRDVLLIAIYQKLHEKHVDVEIENEDEDNFEDDVE